MLQRKEPHNVYLKNIIDYTINENLTPDKRVEKTESE